MKSIKNDKKDAQYINIYIQNHTDYIYRITLTIYTESH
jgi:hypothetical protein